MPTSSNRLIMFAKAPVPGRVKTRLTTLVTEAEAAELHASFLHDLSRTLHACATAREGIEVFLSWAGERGHPVFDDICARTALQRHPQHKGDLGAKLLGAFRDHMDAGAESVCVIGSDSPTLSPQMLLQAFDALESSDVVLGPSFDGGYYLIGMNAVHPEVFRDIDWSTPDVLKQTLRRIRQANLDVTLLEFWYDVDTAEDLAMLRTHLSEYLASIRPHDYSVTRRYLKELAARGYFD